MSDTSTSNTAVTAVGGKAAATGGNASALSGFMQGGGYGMIAQGIGGIASAFPTPNADLNSNNLMMALGRQMVSQSLLSSGNPYAMAAGAAVMVLDKTGGFSDASEGLGTGNDIGNAIMSFALPGAGYFMKKTDNYEMSADMAVMQSGYQGSVEDAHTAEGNAGAKLFFGRDKANSMIAKAKAKDAMISNIKQDADLDFLTARSMTQNKAMSNQYNLQGGYNQAGVRVGKFGMLIERIKAISKAIKFKEPSEIYTMKDGGVFFKDIFMPTSEELDKNFFDNLFADETESFKKGGKIKIEMADGSGFIEVDSLDEDQKAGRKPIGHKNGKRLYLSGDGKKAMYAENPANELTQYLLEGGKTKKYKTFDEFIKYLNETDRDKESEYDYEALYNDDDAYFDWENREEKEPGKAHFTDKYKKPGHMTYNDENYGWKQDADGNWIFTASPRQMKEHSYDEYVDYWNRNEANTGGTLIYGDKTYKVSNIPTDKDGGQMNVIPEGSLHARLHHMENADNLTKKGIPVIDNEGNQQAEIEHSEIIFNLETTKTLEELCKKYKSDDYTAKEKENFAIEAGRLLSIQIMENTDDRVGLINKIEK